MQTVAAADYVVGISIHAPHAGRDLRCSCVRACRPDFNPRAPCGARRSSARWTSRRCYFNPRAPCGARLDVQRPVRRPHDISIHAPHAGRDPVGREQQVLHDISIHAPHAGRDVSSLMLSLPVVAFQSTRPMRGATRSSARWTSRRCYFNPRAPCGARRRVPASRGPARTNFNPRAPCGARRTLPPTRDSASEISIHAPHAGRDLAGVLVDQPPLISIHAPHAGRDGRQLLLLDSHFVFQSTRPMRGATRSGRGGSRRKETFQSTRPMRGATPRSCSPIRPVSFQSTRPMRGATVGVNAVADVSGISIHAPHAGRDRLHDVIVQVHDAISIHAPHAGRDKSFLRLSPRPGVFQSTRPMRGATA